MSWKDKPEDAAAHDEVNVTPIIDVSLVLVVILLLATPLAFESAIAVKRADTSGQEAKTETEVEDVEVVILDDENLKVNRVVVSRSDLRGRLRVLLTPDTPRRVVITCRDEASHGVFVSVLDEAKLAGAAEIAVMGE